MRRILLSVATFTVVLYSCNNTEESTNEDNNTIITKGEDRTDLNIDNEMKDKGEAFLTEMELKEGVAKTASGLLYEVIEEGSGDNPISSNTVKVNYTGKFIDGKVFDSTEGKNPIEFGLTQVISGWTEGLQLMNKGAKYRFYIPYQLGYGPQGYPGAIPPFSALIFDVELIDYK